MSIFLLLIYDNVYEEVDMSTFLLLIYEKRVRVDRHIYMSTFLLLIYDKVYE
jgi:hypothetical protein